VIEKALSREGIAFNSFSSAQDALDALSGDSPEVLVSDIRMPGESGLSLLAKVKERYPHIPVIVMTAYSDLESAVAAFQGGAFEYLPKPFDVHPPLALIRRATAETPPTPPVHHRYFNAGVAFCANRGGGGGGGGGGKGRGGGEGEERKKNKTRGLFWGCGGGG